MDIAMKLALASLSGEVGAPVDAAVLEEGLYQAAKTRIVQNLPLSVDFH
jgi:hypothetical protein